MVCNKVGCVIRSIEVWQRLLTETPVRGSRSVFLPRRIISNFHIVYFFISIIFFYCLDIFISIYKRKPSYTFPKNLYLHIFLLLNEIKFTGHWSNISNTRGSVSSRYPNTEKRVENFRKVKVALNATYKIIFSLCQKLRLIMIIKYWQYKKISPCCYWIISP